MDTLTVEDRIMVLLSQYSRYSRDYVCPPGMTQQGICDRLGLSQAHVSGELKKLLEADFIGCRTTRVMRSKTKKNVYFLTPIGENVVKVIRKVMPVETFEFVSDIMIRERLGLQSFDNLKFLTP